MVVVVVVVATAVVEIGVIGKSTRLITIWVNKRFPIRRVCIVR